MTENVSNYNMSSGNRLRDERGDGGQRFSFDEPDFGSFLRALKRHGCNLLVTGEASEDVFAAMTRRLLGTPSERRVRLLGLSDTTRGDAEHLLPGDLGVRDSMVWVLDHSNTTRDVATDGSSLAPTSSRSDLLAFQDEVCDAIERFEAEGDVAPAELRVGIVSLCPFVDAYETETVAEFARTVGSRVLEARGMAHYQLPTADDEPIVDELQPEFDARIEVRKSSDHPLMHRWHVPEHDLTTPWVEI